MYYTDGMCADVKKVRSSRNADQRSSGVNKHSQVVSKFYYELPFTFTFTVQ